jgi:5-methylcytosine-specific restriction endonuclease McrA
MPTVPTNTKCNQLGCKEERSKYNSFCPIHGGVHINTEERKAFQSMYQTKQWKRKRQIELSRNTLCASCLYKGIITQASHIDHVFPWTKIGKEAFYNNLFQTLCPECHSYKTGQEQKGSFLWWHENKEESLNLHQYREKCTKI